MENMYDLVRANNWTIPKMMGMCKTVAHDVNGDGIMDINDCYGHMAVNFDTNNFIIASGIRYTQKDNAGIPQIAFNKQRTVDVVEMCVP
ncbi:MAG: hypothetical protein FWF15_10080, partial [Oscillospiraceae bacterium]|nr:hypothetical protein [Oscillospiraceae bacterium]